RRHTRSTRDWSSDVCSSDLPLDGRRALWWPRTIDIDALGAAAARLAGEHDFRAFTPTETEHDAFRRDVRAATWEVAGDRLDFVRSEERRVGEGCRSRGEAAN